MFSPKPYFTIIRPINCFLAGFSLVIGILITMGYQILLDNLYVFSLGLIIVILISAGGFIINDIYDIEIDKINQPNRILPSGKISLTSAWIYTVILFIIGLLLSLYSLTIPVTFNMGIIPPIMVVIGIISLFLYAAILKKLGLIGNLVIIALSTIPFFVGGLFVNDLSKAVFPVLIVLTVQYSREIIKDVDDIKGDVAASDFIINLPTIIGIKNTILIGKILLFLTVLITLLPFTTIYFSTFKSWGVVIVALTLDIICLYSILFLTGNDEALIAKSRKVKVYLKLGIFLGLVGLAFNSFTLI